LLMVNKHKIRYHWIQYQSNKQQEAV